MAAFSHPFILLISWLFLTTPVLSYQVPVVDTGKGFVLQSLELAQFNHSYQTTPVKYVAVCGGASRRILTVRGVRIALFPSSNFHIKLASTPLRREM